MSSQTEQIKAKLSIAEVIGSYVKLEKAGGNFKARCPFHNEKTPSFYVSPSRDSYHCFGCNRGGDIFTFVQEIEGLDFLGSLEVLARRAGVELKPVDVKARGESDRLHAVLEEAAKFYHTNLLQNSEAKEYLKKRKITEETVRSFRLGYSQPDWGTLYDHLKQKGFSDDEIEKTGLSIRTSQSVRHAGGRFYDRFRGRVMFPLNDQSGRPVGFSGRILVPNKEREEAKYINSPQTALYDKSRILFGYDKAKQEIRRQDFCVLVEGQMDLISSHQAGVKNCVAVSGTALTAHHLNLVKRLSDNLVMAFDGDTAGISAARKGIDLALSLGMEVKIALLPDGLDPADLVAQDEASWARAVATATNVIDFYLAALARKGYDPRTLNKKIAEEVLPYVARLGNIIDQAHFIGKIAAFVGTKEEPVWDELKKIRLEPVDSVREAAAVAGETANEPARYSRQAMMERKLFGLLYWAENLPDLESKLAAVLGADQFAKKSTEYANEKDTLSLEAELSYDGNEFLASEVEDLLAGLKEELLGEELSGLLGKIRLANLPDDEQARCLARIQEIGKERENLKRKS